MFPHTPVLLRPRDVVGTEDSVEEISDTALVVGPRGDVVGSFQGSRHRVGHAYTVPCHSQHFDVVLAIAKGDDVLGENICLLKDGGEGDAFVDGRGAELGHRGERPRHFELARRVLGLYSGHNGYFDDDESVATIEL
jgi:hypothetical protein